MKNRNAIAALFVLSAVPLFAAMPTKFALPDPARLEINKGRTIQFQYPLPRMSCGDARCGTTNTCSASLQRSSTSTTGSSSSFSRRLRVAASRLASRERRTGGRIRAGWRRVDGKVEFICEVPEGVEAESDSGIVTTLKDNSR